MGFQDIEANVVILQVIVIFLSWQNFVIIIVIYSLLLNLFFCLTLILN